LAEWTGTALGTTGAESATRAESAAWAGAFAGGADAFGFETAAGTAARAAAGTEAIFPPERRLERRAGFGSSFGGDGMNGNGSAGSVW
jgi:hypothetical protein